MKTIEEFIRIMEHDVDNHGKLVNSSEYKVKLNDDGIIEKIEFPHMPSQNYLNTCDPVESMLVKEWLEYKLKVMNEWKNLYNKTVRAYNDYCGKRAGESNELLDLVVGGYSIANVLPFKPAIKQKIKEKSL